MASACSVAVAIDPKGTSSDFLRTPAATTCILVTISFVCTCFLVVCGVIIVREYSLATSYDSTLCHLKNVSYLSEYIGCTYCSSFKDKNKEKGAATCVSSHFPCVRLTVSYDVAGQIKTALLHPDSLQATGAYGQCSFGVCLKNREENRLAVEAFVKDWLTRTSNGRDKFHCYYNTRDHSSVIARKTYSASDVVHAMLWPSLVVVACGVIFLRLEMQRRHLTLCGQKPSSPSYQANSAFQSAMNSSSPGDRHSSPQRHQAKQRLLESASSGQRVLHDPLSSHHRHHRRASAHSEPTLVYKSLPSLLKDHPYDTSSSSNDRREAFHPLLSSPDHVRHSGHVVTLLSNQNNKSLKQIGQRSASVDKYTTINVLL